MNKKGGHRPNIWGTHAVRAAWGNPERRIHRLLCTEQALKEMVDQAVKGRPAPTIIEKHQLDRMLPPGAVHQGIALDAAPLEEVFVQDLAVKASGLARAVVLMLDQVTDPHNVGAILRSASAFGALGVVMQSRHAPELTGVLAKAACGAVDHLPVAYETNLSRALDALREAGFTAVGLDERGEKTIDAIETKGKIVLVLGAEGKGIRPGLREHCDCLARLPTQGAIQSLNVSNAAAVALYAVTNR